MFQEIALLSLRSYWTWLGRAFCLYIWFHNHPRFSLELLPRLPSASLIHTSTNTATAFAPVQKKNQWNLSHFSSNSSQHNLFLARGNCTSLFFSCHIHSSSSSFLNKFHLTAHFWASLSVSCICHRCCSSLPPRILWFSWSSLTAEPNTSSALPGLAALLFATSVSGGVWFNLMQ